MEQFSQINSLKIKKTIIAVITVSEIDSQRPSGESCQVSTLTNFQSTNFHSHFLIAIILVCLSFLFFLVVTKYLFSLLLVEEISAHSCVYKKRVGLFH